MNKLGNGAKPGFCVQLTLATLLNVLNRGVTFTQVTSKLLAIVTQGG